MAGLAPMMFGLSLDFISGGYSIDSPTALWWRLGWPQLHGVWLGIATVLTLVFTPSLLAVRVWIETYVMWDWPPVSPPWGMQHGKAADGPYAAKHAAQRPREIIWDEDHLNPAKPVIMPLPDAAE